MVRPSVSLRTTCPHAHQRLDREAEALCGAVEAVLGDHPLNVDLALLRASDAALAPARMATVGPGRDLALRLLVPPLLIGGGPYLFRAAVDAGEGLIDIEARTWPIRAVMQQLRLLGRDCAGRHPIRLSPGRHTHAFRDAGTLLPASNNLRAPLPPVLHVHPPTVERYNTPLRPPAKEFQHWA